MLRASRLYAKSKINCFCPTNLCAGNPLANRCPLCYSLPLHFLYLLNNDLNRSYNSKATLVFFLTFFSCSCFSSPASSQSMPPHLQITHSSPLICIEDPFCPSRHIWASVFLSTFWCFSFCEFGSVGLDLKDFDSVLKFMAQM